MKHLIPAALLLCIAFLNPLHAQPSAFTYRGQLVENGTLTTGLYQLQFALHDTATDGTALNTTNHPAVQIIDGLFTVTLDFGPEVFDGGDRWLEIAAGTNGSASLQTLTPRQPILSTPYATLAAGVSGSISASQLSGDLSPANIADGSIPSLKLTGPLDDSLLSSNVAMLNLPAQRFTGINLFNHPFNSFVGGFSGSFAGGFIGTFTGNGFGLTNFNAAQLNGTVGTNLIADGSITSAKISGPLEDSLLTTNVALLDRLEQTFSGINAFTNSSNAFTGTFLGDGAGLANLDATQLIGLLPTDAIADSSITSTKLSGPLDDAILSTNVSLLHSPEQTFSGINAFTNPDNAFTGTFNGTFIGDGASLTNLDATQLIGLLPSDAIADNSITSAKLSGPLDDGILSTNVSLLHSPEQTFSGINAFTNPDNAFTGTFIGDGSGLANVTATEFIGALSIDSIIDGSITSAKLSAPLDDGILSPNVALLDSPEQTFSGFNAFTNPSNAFTGTFSGDGADLANLNAAQLIGILPADSIADGSITSAKLSGPLDDGLLSPSVPLLGQSHQTFSGTNVFINSGNFFIGTFIGNGGGLTNIKATQLTGTLRADSFANGSITSAKLSGPLDDGILSPNVALLDSPEQTFSGINTFSNPSNAFTGIFTGTSIGDGNGLTNLNATQLIGILPADSIADDSITSAKLSGPLEDGLLSPNVPLLDNTNQTFSGINTFTHPSNAFTGTFIGTSIGDGNSLTNLNATQLIGILPTDAIADGSITSTKLSAPLDDGLLSPNVALLDSPEQTFSGINAFINASNAFAGTFNGIFNGDGSGLTNLTTSQPAGTNVALLDSPDQAFSGINTFINPSNSFSGTFTGDGSGLTNLASSQPVGTNVALLDGPEQTFSGINSFINPSNAFIGNFTGDGNDLTNLNATQLTGTLPTDSIADGSVTSDKLSGPLNDGLLSTNVALLDSPSQAFSGANTFHNPGNSFLGSFNGEGSGLSGLWRTGGNSTTTPGIEFIGTTDNADLDFRVNNQRVLRLEDNGDGTDLGSTPDGAPNLIAGSSANVVGPSVVGATISGGGATDYSGQPMGHSILSDYSTVGGGLNNRIASGSLAATIAGGQENSIAPASNSGTIGGGSQNRVGSVANYATVPGGFANEAHADYSFAAGRRAKADHNGAFVWADSEDADFASTATNQFSVRATGGVRFETGENPLTVDGNVGVGTATPNSALHVNGPIATSIAMVEDSAVLDGSNSVILYTGVDTAIITLPTAVGIKGRQYTVKWIAQPGLGQFLAVAAQTGETIDGFATYPITARWQFVTLVSNGTDWYVIAK